MTEGAGADPVAYAEEPAVANEVHAAVVIRGERLVDGYIERLAGLARRDR